MKGKLIGASSGGGPTGTTMEREYHLSHKGIRLHVCTKTTLSKTSEPSTQVRIKKCDGCVFKLDELPPEAERAVRKYVGRQKAKA